MADLAGLLDKSLIRRGANSRFNLHALIQMFAVEKLNAMPNEQVDVKKRHYWYYRELLGQTVIEWQDSNDPATLKGLRPEVGNLRSAWSWISSRPTGAR